MAYAKKGLFTYVQNGYSQQSTFIVTCSVETTNGLYGIVTEKTVKPFFGISYTGLFLDKIKSIDNKTITYNCHNGNNNKNYDGTAKEISCPSVWSGTAVSAIYGTNTWTKDDVGSIVCTGTASFPLFRDTDIESINNYIETGDDSGAVNYDDLHGVKTNFFLTNNGDRISLKIVPQNDGTLILLDKTIISFKPDVPLINTVTKTITSFEFNTSWESMYGIGVNTLNVTIEGYYKENKVCTLTAIMKKGVVLGLGNPICTPIKAIDNDYKLYCSTNNMFDDISTPEEDSSDATGNNNDGSSFGGLSNLVPTYKISKQALNDLGRFIWTDNAFSNIKLLNNSPIDNILSLMYMPIDITNGSASNVILGNIDTNISGVKLEQTMIKKTYAQFIMPRYNNGFLAFEPYTSVSLYLPFVGMTELQPKDVCGYEITIEYAFDIVCGSFGVFVYTSKGGGKTLIFTSQGECCVNIPLSSSNLSNFQASLLQSGVSLIGDVATKNVGGASSELVNIATAQNKPSTFGSPSSMIGALCPTYCYYIVRTPIILLPDNFAHTKGYICMDTYKMSDLKGFTILSSDIDLSGFNATEIEKTELINILTSGFYL